MAVWPAAEMKKFRGLNGRPVIKMEHIRRLTGRPTERSVMKMEQIWRLTMMAKILNSRDRRLTMEKTETETIRWLGRWPALLWPGRWPLTETLRWLCWRLTSMRMETLD